MPLLRLLPVALVASAFLSHADAQAVPSTPKPPIILRNANPGVSTEPNTPCAKLRTYGFTTRDLKSYDPRPSTYTTCTPATISDLKQIQLGPGTLKTLKATPSTR